jgi:hypothetical protein
MKKTYRVRVDVSIPVMVIVEADDRDDALAIGTERARAVIGKHLPERSSEHPYEFVATEAREMVPPKNWDA